MTSRLLSLLVWALVAASGVTWGLKLLARPAGVPPNTETAQTTAPVAGPIERLMGRPPPAPVADEPPQVVADNRFKLLGVVAARSSGDAAGWALISVDGQAPRAVALGREIEPGLRLLSVAHRRVELGAAAGAPTVALELPPLADAARGRLADATPGAAVDAPAGAAPATVPPMPAPGAGPALSGINATSAQSNARNTLPPRGGMPAWAAQQAAQQATQQAAQQAAQQAQQAGQPAMDQSPSVHIGTSASEQDAQATDTQGSRRRTTAPLSR